MISVVHLCLSVILFYFIFRYQLHFFKESKAAIERRTKQAREIIKQVSEVCIHESAKAN